MSIGSDRPHAINWQALADALRGPLLRPGDADYENRRRVWNGAIDRHPAAIACCADAEDVCTAASFATRVRLPITVRGGGHNVAGLAVRDDALMLDLGDMRHVDVDPQARIARIEGGALWQDVDAATQPHGLATTGGFVSTTGVGGYTLGGGVGWLMRRCGLAVDNLLEAEVVLADGRSLVASEQRHADLFWGLRGGAGGLGVVTRFTSRLHPVGEVLAGVVFHPIEAAPWLLRTFRDVTPNAPDALTAMLVVTSVPPLPFLPASAHGQRAIALAYCWSGAPEQGARTVAPLAGYGQPLGRHEGVVPYAVWQRSFDPGAPAGHRYYWTTSQLDDLDDLLIEVLLRHAAAAPDPLCELHIHHLGGAVANAPSTATAFAHRDTPFFVNVIGHTAEAGRFPAVRDWTRSFRTALAPHARRGVQPNFAGETADIDTRAHGVVAQARLAELRARYDPLGLLAAWRGG